ncbi:hypothetical protein QP157_18475 [Sphingomonas sp. LR61]
MTTTAASPAPASAESAWPMIAVSAAAVSAYFASASRCTQAIEVPGRMSWNCWSSTCCHRASSSSYG